MLKNVWCFSLKHKMSEKWDTSLLLRFFESCFSIFKETKLKEKLLIKYGFI
jgi:hypothetical protein